MSKRDEVYELFAEGKLPGAPEVEAIGLSKDTVTRYHRDWLKIQANDSEGAAPGEPTEIINLPPLQIFEYEERIYSKRRVHSGGVNAVSKEGDQVIVLSPDTSVIPV